jgi:DNA modification methylase
VKPWLDVDGVMVFHGDCIKVMRQLPDNSVDSVVTDPPYGLEFMGKEWDRLGHVGKTSHSGIADEPGFKGFRLPNYNGSSNAKCQACNKWKWDHEGRKCECAAPDFPNVKAHQAELMEKWHHGWALEALRVLKPGGHLLAFGGTRTWHRLAVAIEDAGFEVRDSVAWMYGSGFPKSLDVSKAIDKMRDDSAEGAAVGAWLKSQRVAAGLKQKEVAALWPSVTGGLTGCVANWETIGKVPTWDQWLTLKEFIGFGDEMDDEVWRLNGRKGTPGVERPDRQVSGPAGNDIFQPTQSVVNPGTPVRDSAQQWQGWGTALKPAHEPIVVARKPLIGTVAENVLTHGTGALNIDGCRIEASDQAVLDAAVARMSGNAVKGDLNFAGKASIKPNSATGRWPANVILDESQAAELDKQSGVTKSGQPKDERGKGGIWSPSSGKPAGVQHGDTGGASRFFYVAKASKKERPNVDGVAHPTVKPLALMRYLVRLVTPPGGTVLEPFAGSGATVEACIEEGFNCIAIERETDYLPLIQHRIQRATEATAGRLL